VRHMYEIGRAPENALHPDHRLAQRLTRGFWAMLPHLDRDLIGTMLAQGAPSGTADTSEALDSDAFRLRLGRIACGYDGGQIYKDDDAGQ